MSIRQRFAILASGRGSNAKAILEACRRGDLQHDPVLVLSNREKAPVLAYASEAKVHSECLIALPQESRTSYDQRVLLLLRAQRVGFVVLAGYDRLLSPEFLGAFDSGKGYQRVVNIHPSLLPAFPGLGSYAKAFHYGAKVTGVTVHLVSEGMDEGPVCAQEAFDIQHLTSISEVEKKGLELEHDLYPRALNWILSEKFMVENRGAGPERRAFVRPS